jgi:hypothetical protein
MTVQPPTAGLSRQVKFAAYRDEIYEQSFMKISWSAFSLVTRRAHFSGGGDAVRRATWEMLFEKSEQREIIYDFGESSFITSSG